MYYHRPGGTDNVCCYDNESKLIHTHDSEGGTLQRYHLLGGENV